MRPSLILRTTTRFMLPLLILFSVFLALRGHNEPGGGFVGGLVAASAFALYSLAYGAATARQSLPFNPRYLLAIGLLLAMTSGVIGLVAGWPFLTGLWAEPTLPVIGMIDLGTPLLFDLGVYLVVNGVVVTILLVIHGDGVD